MYLGKRLTNSGSRLGTYCCEYPFNYSQMTNNVSWAGFKKEILIGIINDFRRELDLRGLRRDQLPPKVGPSEPPVQKGRGGSRQRCQQRGPQEAQWRIRPELKCALENQERIMQNFFTLTDGRQRLQLNFNPSLETLKASSHKGRLRGEGLAILTNKKMLFSEQTTIIRGVICPSVNATLSSAHTGAFYSER